jgi:hypothetical protein
MDNALLFWKAEKLDQDKYMNGVLKTGYENGKRLHRISPLGK